MIQSIRPSLDRVAVGTANNALFDLFLGLRNAFCVAYIHSFVVSNMIKMEGGGMSIKSAVTAPHINLVCIKPAADLIGALVRLSVDLFSVSWLLKSLATPIGALFAGRWLAYSVFILAGTRTELCRHTLCLKHLTAYRAGMISWLCRFPRWHTLSVPQRFENCKPDMFHPCKADIFAATYESVEEGQTNG